MVTFNDIIKAFQNGASGVKNSYYVSESEGLIDNSFDYYLKYIENLKYFEEIILNNMNLSNKPLDTSSKAHWSQCGLYYPNTQPSSEDISWNTAWKKYLHFLTSVNFENDTTYPIYICNAKNPEYSQTNKAGKLITENLSWDVKFYELFCNTKKREIKFYNNSSASYKTTYYGQLPIIELMSYNLEGMFSLSSDSLMGSKELVSCITSPNEIITIKFPFKDLGEVKGNKAALKLQIGGNNNFFNEIQSSSIIIFDDTTYIEFKMTVEDFSKTDIFYIDFSLIKIEFENYSEIQLHPTIEVLSDYPSYKFECEHCLAYTDAYTLIGAFNFQRLNESRIYFMEDTLKEIIEKANQEKVFLVFKFYLPVNPEVEEVYRRKLEKRYFEIVYVFEKNIDLLILKTNTAFLNVSSAFTTNYLEFNVSNITYNGRISLDTKHLGTISFLYNTNKKAFTRLPKLMENKSEIEPTTFGAFKNDFKLKTLDNKILTIKKDTEGNFPNFYIMYVDDNLDTMLTQLNYNHNNQCETVDGDIVATAQNPKKISIEILK